MGDGSQAAGDPRPSLEPLAGLARKDGGNGSPPRQSAIPGDPCTGGARHTHKQPVAGLEPWPGREAGQAEKMGGPSERHTCTCRWEPSDSPLRTVVPREGEQAEAGRTAQQRPSQ